MTNSQHLGRLIGPALVGITLSEIANPHIWTAVTAPVVYQAGILAFIAGLAIVRAHNRWAFGWPISITLLGWFAIVAGLCRMFASDAAQQVAQNPSVALAFEVVLLVIGLFVTYKSYLPAPRPTSSDPAL